MVEARKLAACLEKYQKARKEFVQEIADAATMPTLLQSLNDAGVLQLLRPLLLDNVPAIQRTAALALGRLANQNDDMAEQIVALDILPQLVYSLAEQNGEYQQLAAFVLRAVAKHSPDLAKAVVACGALDALVTCLENFDVRVKEEAAWCLGYIAKHSQDLAQQVLDSGAVPLLVMCIGEPELSLKRIAASALADIAKHSPELAQAVVDADAVKVLEPLLEHNDTKLKRQVCSCLGQVSKHSVELAEVVVDGGGAVNTEMTGANTRNTVQKLLLCVNDLDPAVKKNAAMCVREICKHSGEMAQLLVTNGGVEALIAYLMGHNGVPGAKGNARLPAIMSLGYIAAFSETLALAVIVKKGVAALAADLDLLEPREDHVRAAAAWSVGQIGRHSVDHVKAVADMNLLPKLLALHLDPDSTDDLKKKSKTALKQIIQHCGQLEALEQLLVDNAPEAILKHVIEQVFKLLSPQGNVDLRQAFVKRDGLRKLLDIHAPADSQMAQHIEAVKTCYPPEVVNYFDANYSEQLMESIANFGGQ
eukprot:Rmarinus@m.2484